MTTYSPPLRDMKFVLRELFDGDSLATLPGYEDFTPDLIDAVLEESGKLSKEVLFPLNISGDVEGCTFENGVVRTPKGFKEAYQQFTAGGWTGIAADPAYGGQGLPKAVNMLVEEMICSANMAFGMYPGLTHGAYNAVTLYGTDDQKALYLPKFADGSWSGTMCLTEPHCGTDLGLIRTKADPHDDSYKITGTKIFISAGEHDLTENIVHLVLAKLPDAPPGVKGISLFVVPKFLPKDDGSVGVRNGVACGSIEHKMGIKASSTCVINFDGATGWLVGEKHKGMRAMFAMMNTARLGVGVQGLGLAETAYQSALLYARERLQGRALKGGPAAPDKPADPLLVHPDVRKNLLTMKSITEGQRALVVWTAIHLDLAQKAATPEERQRADDLVQLLTPIVKSFGTDGGFEVTNLGVQIYGGHGYIREHGMEQLVRDARITQIYEGTNGIQALDLVGRKMPAHFGRYLRAFFHPVQEFIEANAANPAMEEFVMNLAKAFGRLQQTTGMVAQKGLSNPDEAGAAATDYLNLFAYVAIGYLWARTAKLALAKQDDDPTGFYKAKLKTARFYMARVLPRTGALMSQIMAGADTIMDMDDALFDAA